MGKQIKRTDIVEKDIFKNLIDSADASISKLKLMNDQFVLMAKTIKSSMKTAKFDTTKELNEFIKATKNATTVSKEQVKVMQELEKANALKAKAQQELIRVEKEQLKLQDQAIKSARTKLTDDEKQEKINIRKQKSIEDEANAYKRLEKNTRDLKNQSKQLGATLLELERDGKKNTKEFTDLERKFRDVTRQAQVGDHALKKLDKTVGDNFRNVGNYSSGLDKLRSGLGALGIAFGIGTIVRSASKTILEFDKSIADLVSITGASGKDLEFFKEQSVELGKSVEGGAKNVIEAYKLIGSAKPELLKNAEALNMVTEAAIKLSHASGMELPDAATRLTDAMNQFNAPAAKAGEFINVLANGALFGAAEIPQITESLLEFGAVAKTSNVSIQESTALIEMLASKGVKGAEAGTALRNVMLKLSAPEALPKKARDYLSQMGIDMKKLSDTSVPFADRLKELTPILNNEAAQVKIFGLENIVAAKNLLMNVDGIKKLTKEMETKGTVDKQATARTKTLNQALIELKGGWDQVVLSFSSGKGASAVLTETLGFLGRNLGTILKSITLLTTAYYGSIAIQKIKTLWNKTEGKSLSDLGGWLKSAVTGTKKLADGQEQASSSAKAFGTALKSIGFAIVLELLIEMSKALYDVASGAQQAREDMGRLEKASDTAMKSSQKNIDLIKQRQSLANAQLSRDLKEQKINQDEFNKSVLKNSQLTQEQLKAKIKASETQKAIYQKDLQLAKDNQANEKRAMADGTMDLNKTFDERKRLADKNKIKGDKSLLFGIETGERDVASSVDLIAQLTANIKGQDVVLKEYNKALNENTEEVKDNNSELIANNLQTKESTKSKNENKISVRELDTTFKDLNATISEQVALLNELDNIYKNRAIDLKVDEVKAEYDKQIKLAEETGVANVDLLEQLLQEETNLKKKQAEDNLNFKIDQLQKEYDALVTEKQKELDLEKATLLGQKGITPQAKKTIEANYLVKQKELDALLLISHEELETKKTIAAEKTADEILSIEKDKNDQVNQLNDGVYEALLRWIEKMKGAKEDEVDSDKEINDKKVENTKQMFNDLNKLAQMSATYFLKQSEKKISQIEKEMDALNTQKNFLEQMAVNGNITAEKSLAQNDKLTAEANKKKAKEIKKQERIKLAESVFTSYTANVANNEKSPIVKTISDISVLTAFINSLPTFYKGTERTVGESLGKAQLSGRDGHIVRVDGSEKILNPTLSKMTGNMTTLEIAQLAEDKLRGKIMSKGGTSIQLLETNYSNDVIVEKLDQLNNTILNKPEMNVEVGEILGGVMHVVESTKNTRQTVRNITRFS